MYISLLYQYPIWFTAVLFILILLLALEIGFRIGRLWKQHDLEAGAGSGDIALTAMYALLGLVLAFTYSFTITRADHRKQAIIAEANALGTAFLRAGLAPEPIQSELRSSLREYAATRIIPGGTGSMPEEVRGILEHTLEAQAKIWPIAVRVVGSGVGGPIESAIIQSVNEVMDMHSVRMAASFDRLPAAVLWVLVFIGSACLAVSGYNRGLVGSMNRFRMTALALVLTLVMTIITDFDRGMQGFVRLSQHSLVDTLQSMDAGLAKSEVETSK